jgi:predicted aconitase
MVTAGRATLATIARDGTLARLAASGVTVLPDLCWCSISEPVLPPDARVVATTSGKYAHYGPGLHGRRVRLADMEDCAAAALTGRMPARLPDWLL